MPMLADRAARVRDRIAAAWRDAAAASVAGALAWVVAVELFGHAHPLFAAITAIVCLAPGLPNHGRQAVGLILGVTTGIVVGEIAVQFPDTYPLLRVSLTAFVAILVASAYGLAPVVPIQAGVSAILVLALGPATAGVVRFLDVAAGTATGLLFSQVLLTPDPVRLLDDAAADLVARLRSAFRAAAAALGSGDQARAQAAVETFSSAHASLAALTGAIDTARSAARWSLRGRLAARRVLPVVDMYDRRAARLYASALLFGTALASAMARGAPPPPALLPRLRHLIDMTEPEAAPQSGLPDLTGLADEWRRATVRLEEAIEALDAFLALTARSAAIAPPPPG